MAVTTAPSDAVPPGDATSSRDTPAIEERASGRSLGWWGTVCLIGTEGMLFALFFGNFYLRAQAAEWPLADISDPELKKSGIRTIVLLASTIPAVVAERASKRSNIGIMRWGLFLTWSMGTVFLLGHVDEYFTIWKEYTPSTNAYGSVYYTITSFHALHVLVGLFVLAFLFWRSFVGDVAGERHAPVENGILYWHFVDVVWVFVYSSLYLSVVLW